MTLETQADPQNTITVGPHYPNWVFTKHKKGSINWQYSSVPVEVFDISFLGLKCRAGHYLNRELCNRLIKTQKNLYDICLKEKRDLVKSHLKGDVPEVQIFVAEITVPEVTEDEFRDWCWQGLKPGDKNIETNRWESWLTKYPYNRDTVHIGFRDGNARHGSASAIDINVLVNPWVPLRGNKTKGPHLFAGEKHHDVGTVNDHKKKVWEPVYEVFDVAYSLLYGNEELDTFPKLDEVTKINNKDKDTAGMVYDRFYKWNLSIIRFFSYAFDTINGDAYLPKKVSLAEFKSRFLKDLENGQIHKDAMHVDKKRKISEVLADPATQLDKDKALEEYYNYIIKSLRPFSLATVNGSIIENNGVLNGSGRNPLNGIFSIRKEVFIELLITGELRWGGNMFPLGGGSEGDGNDNGDVQHFDLDFHYVNGNIYHGENNNKLKIYTEDKSNEV